MNGLELEKTIMNKFIVAGWKVKYAPRCRIGNDRCVIPDFEILVDEDSYGFVDVYFNRNPEIMLNKVRSGQMIIEELKPKLYIITDGIEYHISLYGKPFETIHYVPGPRSYFGLLASIGSCTKSIKDKEKNDEF